MNQSTEEMIYEYYQGRLDLLWRISKVINKEQLIEIFPHKYSGSLLSPDDLKRLWLDLAEAFFQLPLLEERQKLQSGINELKNSLSHLHIEKSDLIREKSLLENKVNRLEIECNNLKNKVVVTPAVVPTNPVQKEVKIWPYFESKLPALDKLKPEYTLIYLTWLRKPRMRSLSKLSHLVNIKETTLYRRISVLKAEGIIEP